MSYMPPAVSGAVFVNVQGDSMTGPLGVVTPEADNQATPKSYVDQAQATAKAYVDAIVTVSDVPPDPVANVPSRDGLLWVVVEAGA